MSEKQRGPGHQPEHAKHQEHEAQPHHQGAERQPAHHGKHEKAAEHDPGFAPETVKALQEKIHEEAKSQRETPIEAAQEPEERSQLLVNRDLKTAALQRSLAHIRRQLSWPSKKFSKVIHNPIVNAASETGAKTIARPYPLLTAGVLALVGSSVLLFTAKRYGFRYNITVLLALIAGGYLLGLVLEVVLRLRRR